MTYQRTSIRYGLGIAGFGAAARVLTALFLFTLPQQFLGDATAEVFLQNWFGPIATAGNALVAYVTPILAGVAALFLVKERNISVAPVLGGFAVGAIAFGLGVTLTNWTFTGAMYRGSTVEYAMQTTRQTLRLFGPALVGAVAGAVLSGESDLLRE